MVIKNPLPQPPPRRYWEDSRWAHEHAEEIAERYPNQWVAVTGQQVVAAGQDGAEVERIAMEKAGHREIVMIFAEKGIDPFSFHQSQGLPSGK